jgi:hypothetical protein
MADTNKKKKKDKNNNEPTSSSSSPPSEQASIVSNSQNLTYSQHQATTQLGGKGTIRRRRLRKTHHLSQHSQISTTSHELQNFMNKFKLSNYGTIDSVTFVKDNCKIQTYNSIDLHANLNSGIYQLNIKTKVLNKNNQLIPTKGKIENAEDLLNEINNSDSQDRINEINHLIGSDANVYLRELVENYRNNSSTITSSTITSSTITSSTTTVLPILVNKEKSSQILSSNNQYDDILNEKEEQITTENRNKRKKNKKKKNIEDGLEKTKYFQIANEGGYFFDE